MAKKKHAVVVDRSFLMNLADEIYNPVTRRFLRLCDGKLQNGPDPVTGKPMHCGLGELYFAMTGKQPHQRPGVQEDDVINLAVELSVLPDIKDKMIKDAIAHIKALKLPNELSESLVATVRESAVFTEHFEALETNFRDVLDYIPETNDSTTCGEDACSYDVYRSRASKVATQLRKAARLLTR